jgi:hypothetical protein
MLPPHSLNGRLLCSTTTSPRFPLTVAVEAHKTST